MARIALAGIVLGLATFAYFNLVLLPALSVPGGLDANFPPCPNTNRFFRFTTQGVVEPIDRFLCMVLPFFVNSTNGLFGSWHWAEFLITLVPLAIHAVEASTTAQRGFWGLLIPFVVSALGQVVGLGVTLPLLGLPIYALSGASRPASRETSVPMAWATIITAILFLLPGVLFFVFPHGSDLWVYVTCVFQASLPFMFLFPLPVALCLRNPGDQRTKRAKAHALLLFLYGLAFGACFLAHIIVSLRLAQQSQWNISTFLLLAIEAWNDMKIRFLLVDHGSTILAALLMVILDGGLADLFLVLILSPFVSVGGAISLFYAKPHINWFSQEPDQKKKNKGKRE